MNLKSIFARLGIPPPLWVTNSPSRIYEYQILLRGLDLRGASVLDFGCGEGVFAAALAARADHVWGVDLSPTVAERAQRFFKYSPRKRKIKFHAGTLPSLNLPANSIDHIFCACVLQLVNDLPAELAEMRRVLKPGGWIHATVDSFTTVQDEAKKRAYAQTHGIVEFFRRESAAQYFRNAGFEVVVNQPILAGAAAQTHFARYFENSAATYGILQRIQLAKQMSVEDQSVRADSPSAEILIRAQKTA
ncbi:MAG: hypothetical protein Fur002_05400 [Anaerolineales bacterium]